MYHTPVARARIARTRRGGHRGDRYMRVVRPLLIPIALFSAARRRTRFRAVGCGRRRPAAGVGLDDAGGPSGDDAARARWDDVPRRAMRFCRGARRPRLNVRIVDQYTGEIYSRLILSRPVLLGRAAPGDTDSIPAGDVVRLSGAAYRDRRADDDGEGRPAVSAMLHVVGAIAPDAFTMPFLSSFPCSSCSRPSAAGRRAAGRFRQDRPGRWLERCRERQSRSSRRRPSGPGSPRTWRLPS